MPRRSPPGNRVAMEAALGPDQLRALHEQCQLQGVPLHRWHTLPALNSFGTTAVLRLAKQIRQEKGGAQKDAVDEAAKLLGFSPDTIVTRTARAIRDVFRPAA